MNDKFEQFKKELPIYVRSEDDFKLYKIRHSAEHIFNQAVEELWPDRILRAIGPAIENGFYMDARWNTPLSEEEFEKIEAKMQEIVNANYSIRKEVVEEKKAREIFKNNPFKQELIDEFVKEGSDLSLYWTGDDFVDLCKGPHVDSTGEVKVFKILKIAGAYWHGDEKNEMLTRVYGTAFTSKEDLDNFLWKQEEAKKRDHRKLGKELDLFVFSDLVGSGLPMFTPRGTVLREEINKLSQELREKRGFKRVWTPHLTKNDLYKVSGHWDKFGDELFLVKSQETTDEMVLKPMNCPHHQQIFASRPRSYKELPLKYMETTTDYRDEKAGELLGLSRVRSLTQDDSHIFCTREQIEDVYGELIEIVKDFYSILGMKYRARLSFRDPENPEKYIGEPDLWDKAQEIILTIAKKNELDYFVAEGEAAFYGPKIDFMVEDALGREWQLSTPQLDFVQPKRFDLKYVDNVGQEQTPVMIHFAIAGALERFLSVFIEHTAGAFPSWIAPVQVQIIPISDQNIDYAKKLEKELFKKGIRVEVDSDSERMQNKIRQAQSQKIPYMIIVGKKEEEEDTIALRYRSGEEVKDLKFNEFLERLLDNINSRSSDIKLV